MTDYHANRTHTSRGQLATFAESRRLYEAMYVTKTLAVDENSDDLTIGTATHAIALNDVLELSKIVEIPDDVLASNGARSGSNWHAWRAGLAVGKHAADPDRPKKTLMKPEQIELARKCAESIHATIGPLLSSGRAYRELEIYWDDVGGMPCRCKLDYAIENENEVLVIDLKTAVDVSKWGFRSAVRKRRYWLQDAHYTTGASHYFGGKPIRFIFAAVKKTPLWSTYLYELESLDRAKAMRARETLLNDLQLCMETGNWKDEQEGKITDIPALGELN